MVNSIRGLVVLLFIVLFLGIVFSCYRMEMGWKADDISLLMWFLVSEESNGIV